MNGARPASDTMGKLGKVHLTWKRHLQRGLGAHGITLKQVFILRQLNERGFLYPAEIAEMLFCDRPTATVVIRNLERYGWVERQRDPDDGKRVRVLLSRDGSEKLASVPLSAYRTGRTRFDPLSCLDDDEVEALEALLDKLLCHLESLPATESDPGGKTGRRRTGARRRRRARTDGEPD